jgi:outer membrane biosynthesis protein TonB
MKFLAVIIATLLASAHALSTPVEPVEAREPGEPVEPIEAREPVEPIEAREPVEPIEPIEAREPVEPDEPVEARAPPKYFTPTKIWKYNVRSGAISATNKGLVSKGHHNHGRDTTTLMTFTYPAAAAGKKCRFAFYLGDQATLRGTRQLSFFKSSKPAPGPRSSWPPGNRRDRHLGDLKAVRNGYATWDAKYSRYLTDKVPCKAPGTVEAFELAGRGDNVKVEWNPSIGGPRIIYSNH